MADTTTTLPSTPPDSNTPAPSPAAPAQVITPPPTHEIPTTEPSTSEQPVLPDPQIAILQQQLASLQNFASQTVAFFNNRIDSASGGGNDRGRSRLGTKWPWINIYPGTIKWSAGTTLDDLITYSWYLGNSLNGEAGNSWIYQKAHSRDDNGNFSTVFKFVSADQTVAISIDEHFVATGTISTTASNAWNQACAFVTEQAVRFSSSVRFHRSDCTMDPSAPVVALSKKTSINQKGRDL